MHYDMKKKNAIRVLVAMLLLLTMLFTTSCSLDALSALLNPPSEEPDTDESKPPEAPKPSDEDDTTAPDTSEGEDYMTREEVEALISGIKQNVNVTNNDIDITSTHEQNLLAASKGLLSAVSITASFQVTYAYGGGLLGRPSYKTETVTSGGAGVIYQLDKATGSAYIITNYHVVYNVDSDAEDKISDDIKVYLFGQEYSQYYPKLDYSIPATYVGGSMYYDIAVLRISGSEALKTSSATVAEFANSDDLAVLQTVIAIGNPEGEGISATVGAVNVDSESITMLAVDEETAVTMRVIRIDAAVNSGNSGGGLFDEKGRVVGIVNAKNQSSEIDNIAYAIPSNIAKNVADNIIYYDNMNPENDSAYRVVMGIEVTIADRWSEYDTETGKVHKVESVSVASVNAGSIAEGKFQAGDIINSITVKTGETTATTKVTRTFNVFDTMLTARPGSTVTVNITRGTETLDIVIDLTGVTPEAW